MPATGSNQIHYNLSIRVTAGGFSFFVTEAMSGDLMHREDFSKPEGESVGATLSQMLQRPTLQRHAYDTVRVVIDSDSTCIPLEEFHRDEITNLYKFVFSDADLDSNLVSYTLLPQIDVVEAYTVPRDVYDAVRAVYPEAAFTNSYATVLERVAQFCKRRNPIKRPLFAYVQQDQLFVFSIFQDQLLYANGFTLENNQNGLYFLLSVWKELGLDVRENTCFIAGEPTQANALISVARGYLLQVESMDSVDLAHL